MRWANTHINQKDWEQWSLRQHGKHPEQLEPPLETRVGESLGCELDEQVTVEIQLPGWIQSHQLTAIDDEWIDDDG